MEYDINYNMSETAAAFHLDEGKIRVLAGPIGGGKSVSCAFELMRWACNQQPDEAGVRRTRFAVVRNTVDQLKTTTIKTIFDWFPPGVFGEHRIVDKTFTIQVKLGDGTFVNSEWLFLSLDNPADTRKALSLELTGVWLNEAREIHPDVIEVMPTRTGRFPKEQRKAGYGCTRSGMIMDTNLMAADSWFGKRMQDPEKSGWSVFIQPPAAISPEEYLDRYGEDPDETFLDFAEREWAVNPAADNIENLKADYYPTAIEGKSPDFVDVYVRAVFGRDTSGKPVYERVWKREFHVLQGAIAPLISADYPIVIGQDFGRTPSAVFLQGDPRGRITVLSEVAADNCGIERFVDEFLKPHIRQHFPRGTFVVAPDPAGFHKQQLGEVSLVDVLRRAGFKISRPPSNDPEKRIAAVERALTRQIDGKAAFRVHEGCRRVIKGFDDGYRYKIKKTGELEDRPDKNEHSHLADALQYAVQVLEVGVGAGAGMSKVRAVEILPSIGWT